MKRIISLAIIVGCIAIAHAQTSPTMTFTAQTATGNGSVVPILTWATTPTATTCVAAGDPAWTGTKAPAGTQTLAAITSSRTYQLTCTWPPNSTAILTWTAPTQRTDASPLAKCPTQTSTGPCLRSFSAHRGNDPATMLDVVMINDRNAVTYSWSNLPVGVHHFRMKAYDGDNIASDFTNPVSYEVKAESVTRTVAITVNPQPNPPSGLTVTAP